MALSTMDRVNLSTLRWFRINEKSGETFVAIAELPHGELLRDAARGALQRAEIVAGTLEASPSSRSKGRFA